MTDIQSLLQGLKTPSLNIERSLQIPHIEMPRFPTKEEQHAYESSGELLKRLAGTIKKWRMTIPKDAQPVVIAILSNGSAVRASRLIQEGHHGVRVEGVIGDSPCMVLAHQNTIQLLCYVEHMENPEKERSTIGFHYQGGSEQE